jgi:YegS/Rv2252/BmrU family lipid kinase
MVRRIHGKAWLVVVNPNAGRGKGKKDWVRISSELDKNELEYQEVFTSKRGDAIEIVKENIEKGFRNILVVGGDGTMNEVVNGCFQQSAIDTWKLYLAMVTIGTGNDWGRMFRIPNNYEDAIDVVRRKSSCIHDAGIVKYYSGTRQEQRYFINIAGLGFDAVVVKRTNIQKDKGKKSKVLYFYNLLRTMVSYRHTRTEVVIDRNSVINDVLSISLGIGRFSGGGMRQTPNAIHNDGLFDITIINKMRRREILKNVRHLYDGKILDIPQVEAYTGKEIRIDSDPLIHLEADGESLGHSPMEFSIHPRSINIIYGELPV